ncbi:hypothetical protein C8J55DRAFT_564422 [Lentinula edodes]|uniref:S-adenosyl-L-methionine-dependent methyltransferase n=1 Tax=Lentinula lateritia TaxID=40482 RepID=A0A9W9DGS0_9AGAR|nr:hypothetical protein C8J55DRAFT_564422 [Lentinula edodes]
MAEQDQARYYASRQYLLPADQAETKRLNEQHLIVVKAFENRLSLAPLTLHTGDKVLESAAGSGIWALNFARENSANGIEVEIECIDISFKQFPNTFSPHLHFSVHSVVNLPREWSNMFSYVHQRLVIFAMNDSLWRSAINELLRVLQPGGWIELVEFETKRFHWGIGPSSDKLYSLTDKLYAEKGIIKNVSDYLCTLLTEVGFVNVHCETREVPVGGFAKQVRNGYTGEHCGEVCMVMKELLVEGGDSGGVTAEEFDGLVQGAVREWNDSTEVYVKYYMIFAQKAMAS